MTKKTRGDKKKRKSTVPPKVRGMALGSVLAVRQLGSAARARTEVRVELGMPRKVRGQDTYYCPYRIRGVGDGVVRAAYGVDAFQALQLVMHAIGSALANRSDLRFFGSEDLGFPEPGDLHILMEAKRRAPLIGQE